MTGFRDSIGSVSSASWPIDLATHLGTQIENETSPPDFPTTPARQKKESRFARLLKIRDPIAGYNCFGLVFASRRTVLLNPDITLILLEDGYRELQNDEEVQIGDIVVYSDDRGPMHAAIVTRLEKTLYRAESSGITVWVLSKFEDCTGEYEHTIDNVSWNQWSVTHKVYRPRAQTPRKSTGAPRGSPTWKNKIISIGP